MFTKKRQTAGQIAKRRKPVTTIVTSASHYLTPHAVATAPKSKKVTAQRVPAQEPRSAPIPKQLRAPHIHPAYLDGSGRVWPWRLPIYKTSFDRYGKASHRLQRETYAYIAVRIVTDCPPQLMLEIKYGATLYERKPKCKCGNPDSEMHFATANYRFAHRPVVSTFTVPSGHNLETAAFCSALRKLFSTHGMFSKKQSSIK